MQSKKPPRKKVKALDDKSSIITIGKDGSIVFDRDEANRSIASDPRERDISKDERLIAAEKARTEIDGRKRYFGLRGSWSAALITWISISVLFNFVLAVFVGLGYFNFEKYQWFITTVIVETFLQIVGMGYIAVKFFFKDQP